MKSGWEESSHCLQFYLLKHATPKSFKAYYKLSLINLSGRGNEEKSGNRTFKAENDDNWGWGCFLKHKDVIGRGFIDSDEILAKAYVEVY